MQGSVLIIDDSGTVADMLRAALTRLGVDEIEWADSAMKGMRLFHEMDPAVAFVDIQLPDSGGDVLAIEMMRLKRKLKVVVITGLSLDDKRVRDVVSAGAYEVLAKPIRIDAVQRLIQLIEAEEKNLRRVG